MAFTNRT